MTASPLKGLFLLVSTCFAICTTRASRDIDDEDAEINKIVVHGSQVSSGHVFTNTSSASPSPSYSNLALITHSRLVSGGPVALKPAKSAAEATLPAAITVPGLAYSFVTTEADGATMTSSASQQTSESSHGLPTQTGLGNIMTSLGEGGDATGIASPTPLAVVVGTQLISVDPRITNAAVVGTRTIFAGGAGVTVDGTLVSLAPGGIVVGGSTIPLEVALTPTRVTVLGSELISYDPTLSNVLVIGSQTLATGGSAVTIDGVQISVGTNGVIIEGSVDASKSAAEACATIAGEVVSLDPADTNEVFVGSEAISVGGAEVTIDGVPVSMACNGLVTGKSTTVRLRTISELPSSAGPTTAPVRSPSATVVRENKESGTGRRLSVSFPLLVGMCLLFVT